jgi:hypothetical protein
MMTRIVVVLVLVSVRSVWADDVADVEVPPRFGEWGEALEAPYMTVTLGAHMRVLPRTGSRDPGVAARTISQPETTTGSQRSYTFAQRAVVAVANPLFLGVEAEIGLGGLESGVVERSVAAGGLVLVGFHAGFGPIAADVELGGGGRFLETANPTHGLLGGEGVVEVRVRAEIWLTPWFTAGGVLGSSVIAKGDWMAGLYLGFHTWSFGGRR